MPSLTCRNGSWRIQFTSNGVRVCKTLGKITEEEAKSISESIKNKVKKKVYFLQPATDPPNVTPTQLFRLYRKTEYRAKCRKIEFRLSREDLDTLYARSCGACEVTNIQFDNQYKPKNSSVRPWAISVDRIDSSKPYMLDNCRLVCVAVNMGIGQWGLDTFERIAAAVIFKSRTQRKPPRVGEKPRFKDMLGTSLTVSV